MKSKTVKGCALEACASQFIQLNASYAIIIIMLVPPFNHNGSIEEHKEVGEVLGLRAQTRIQTQNVGLLLTHIGSLLI